MQLTHCTHLDCCSNSLTVLETDCHGEITSVYGIACHRKLNSADAADQCSATDVEYLMGAEVASRPK
jgi:hypothetical protein